MSQAGSLHNVGELEDKGIRKVTVLSATRLQELLRVSVNRTLRSQLEDLDLSDEVREQISSRAEAEYGRLVKEGLEAPEEGTPAPAPTNEQSVLDFLNREERNLRSLTEDTVAEPTLPTPAPAAPPVIDSAALEAFEARMVQNITKLIEGERQAPVAPPVAAPHAEQLGALEDRISKLLKALETADRVIATTRPRRGGAPTGKVQGPLNEKKGQLLSALFQANLQMQHLKDEKEG